MSGERQKPSLSALVRRLAYWLVELERYPKRAILAVNDFVLFNIALWLAMSMRLGTLFIPDDWPMFLVLAAGPLIGIATFFQLRVYRMVTRFIGRRGFTLTAGAVGLSALYWGVLVYFSGVYSIPRSVVVLYAVLATGFIWISRQAAASLLRGAGVDVPVRVPERPRNVLIYGAGTTGVQLLESLEESIGYQPVAFVDPSRTLARQYVAGIRVHPPERLGGLIKNYDVDEVLVAMPRARHRERQIALQQLEQLKVRVRMLPATVR